MVAYLRGGSLYDRETVGYSGPLSRVRLPDYPMGKHRGVVGTKHWEGVPGVAYGPKGYEVGPDGLWLDELYTYNCTYVECRCDHAGPPNSTQDELSLCNGPQDFVGPCSTKGSVLTWVRPRNANKRFLTDDPFFPLEMPTATPTPVPTLAASTPTAAPSPAVDDATSPPTTQTEYFTQMNCTAWMYDGASNQSQDVGRPWGGPGCKGPGYDWVNNIYNWDNIYQAFRSVFMVFSMDDWYRVFLGTASSKGINYNTEPQANVASIFFFIIIGMTTFLFIFLFIGGIYGTFTYISLTQVNQRTAVDQSSSRIDLDNRGRRRRSFRFVSFQIPPPVCRVVLVLWLSLAQRTTTTR